MAKNKTIVFIVGMGHSGSTIIDKLIGNSNGAFSYGELIHLATVFKEDNFCTCGSRINNCQFWKPVKGKLESNNKDGNWSLKTGLNSTLSILFSVIKILFNRFDPNKGFIRNTELIYDHTFNQEYNLLVDSSKDVLRSIIFYKYFTKYNVKIIHLVRNPYGVLNSYLKTEGKVKYPGAKEFLVYKRENLYKRTPKKEFSILLRWLVKNIFISVITMVFVKKKDKIVFNYDKILQKESTVNDKLQLLGVSNKTSFDLKSNTSHIVTGNASRFSDKISWKNVEYKKPTGIFVSFITPIVDLINRIYLRNDR